MLAKLKLRDLILLGYGVPVVVLSIGAAGFIYSTTHQVFKTLKDVKRVQSVIIQANEMGLETQDTIRSVRGYFVDPNPQFLAEYQQSRESFTQAANVLDRLIINETQKRRLNRMIYLNSEYQKLSERMLELLDNGQEEQAVTLFQQGLGNSFVEEFDRVNEEFLQAESNLLETETRRAEKALEFLLTILILGSLLLAGLGVGLAFWISSGVTRAIDRATNAIATSSSEIASTIEQQERTSNQQAASVSETTTTVDELGASSRQSAEQAEAAANAAMQALHLTEGGSQAVDRSLERMSELKEKVGAIAEQILCLSEQTNQIGNISLLVSDLANQTNMLALNAAVEAVRAGEQGKGFGVVASEIRKLADQSKQSADKINTLVGDIQNAINSTVMVTDEGTKTVETGVEIARQTADAFAGVADAVNNMVLSNQQILLNIKQQASAIEQIVQAMNSINQGAQETASGISQTKIGTEKLNDAAIELKAIV
ncbi:methyl-accepting chemotaxis protein [Oscillatoria salina]|uniref:methyl-accepting chemotaxis protein n=1 Tax=Oscillatoria salina TaxID=331517 RepID=UPI001CCDBAF5|nr:methyl-accepting chemotaxis protein [Oscillatoria salina]MBZ8178747.1 chemotaxis protein [Oscillatoria salina IIICB1]